MTAHPSAHADVLVVGGGPAGASAAHHLAAQGHRVLLLERNRLPRDKVCGALVTPRAIDALARSGIGADTLAGFHHVDQIRLTHGDRSVTTTWPRRGELAARAVVAPRDVLDGLLINHAVEAGATVLDGHEATAPIVERGFVRGAHVTAPDGTTFEARATFTIIADGANSRFGRALGTFRAPTWPFALAYRSVHRSDLDRATEIEVITDLRDRSDTPVTGYGWIFPRGDGTVNVGVVVLSTSATFNSVNPTHELDGLIADHGPRWRLDPEPVEPAAGGRVPLGHSVGPAAGPTYVLIGDAAGAGNPFTGAGIEGAVETGQLAGLVVADALDHATAATLQRYPQLVGERYGPYYKVARLTDRLLGRPIIMNRFGKLMASRPTVTDAFLRIATNELRAGRAGLAETGYRFGRALSLVAPDA